jgi:hypothetical protein
MKATGLHPGLVPAHRSITHHHISSIYQKFASQVAFYLHEKAEDWKTIDGVSCFKLEPDIDYYKDPGAHLILEVLRNTLTGSLTDPRVVYVLRWTAGRAAGRPQFDPPYVIAQGAPTGVFTRKPGPPGGTSPSNSAGSI